MQTRNVSLQKVLFVNALVVDLTETINVVEKCVVQYVTIPINIRMILNFLQDAIGKSVMQIFVEIVLRIHHLNV
jgi:hypothetical protein